VPVALEAREDTVGRDGGVGIPSASKMTLSARAPSVTRTRGSGRQLSGPGGTISSCGWEVKTGSCQTIQSERGPVSPSGCDGDGRDLAGDRPEDTSALASGTLPTRWTP